MIYYEVTATPDPPLRAAFEAYMREHHVRDVLDTGCFVGAHIGDRDGVFRTTYIAKSEEDLDRYLDRHAQRLRAVMAEKFGDGVVYTREVWRLLQEWVC